MKITQIIMSTFIVVAMACGSSKDSASNEQNSNQANQQNQTTENPQAENATNTTTTQTTQTEMAPNGQSEAKQQAIKYRLILSFISIGEGTDATARATMDSILQKWEAKAGKKIIMETHPWGREGEVDYCFQLTELEAVDQAALAREFREAFQMRPLIQISEYQESMHKR